MDKRKRQPLQAVISDPDDLRLDYIEEFGEMCLQMSGKQGKRVRQLSKDTATCIHSTCHGIVGLTRDLLHLEGYDYVCLGDFSTDPLEKAFSKLRQGSGGTYFIDAKQVSEKFRIEKAKLQITMDEKLACSSAESSSHQCDRCDYNLNEDECEHFDDLAALEMSLEPTTLSCIVHIAGFACRKMCVGNLEDTRYYYEKYGDFTKNLSRGGLSIPGDKICQWTAFSYIMFDRIKEKVCRKSLSRVLRQISDCHNFGIEDPQLKALSNTLFSIHCKKSSPLQGKETKQKVIKLSK